MKRSLPSLYAVIVLSATLAAVPAFAATSALETSGSPWPMQAHDPAHSGISPHPGPPLAVKKWQRQIGGELSAPVIGADGTIYVVSVDLASGSSKLRAFDQNGSEKWRFPGDVTGLSAESPAIASDGTIYFASDKHVYAINPDGTKKWHFSTGKTFTGPPVVGPDGTIYITGSVAAAEEAADLDSMVYSIDAAGSKKWESPLGALMTMGAVALDSSGTVYASSLDASSLDLANLVLENLTSAVTAVGPDGVRKWRYDARAIFSPYPVVVTDGSIRVQKMVLTGGDGTFKLTSLHPDGMQKWDFTPGASVGAGPDAFYFGDLDGMYAVNPDGSTGWRIAGSAYPGASTAIDSGGVVFVATDGSVYAISASGSQRWTVALEAGKSLSDMAIGADSTLYLTSESGSLWAIGGTPTSISIGAAPTRVSLPKPFVLSGVLSKGGVGDPCGVEVKKPGTSRWSYSSARLAYATTTGGGAKWWYRYTPKLRGTYSFRVKFAGDAVRATSMSKTIGVSVR